MKLRAFFMMSGCALAVASLEAAPLDTIDKFAGDVVLELAGYADKVGSYFNLCKPTASQAVSDVAKGLADGATKAFDQAGNANLGDAGQAIADAGQNALAVGKQMLDPNLAYAPVTKWANDNMAAVKIGLCCVATVVVCLLTKKLFFSNKAKSKKQK